MLLPHPQILGMHRVAAPTKAPASLHVMLKLVLHLSSAEDDELMYPGAHETTSTSPKSMRCSIGALPPRTSFNKSFQIFDSLRAWRS